MDKFSEKSLLALGEYYVYGLIDPRNKKLFYIGKGTGQRVFEHEKESLGNPDSEKLKLKTIAEINATGLEVKKIIINCNLTESEAFAAEAALINVFNYIDDIGLTNIVAGHHSTEALLVDDFEKIYGAEELQQSDIRHKIMIIKINQLYQKEMSEDELYDSVRGVWRASLKRVKKVEYVFGVYNSLIVAVYKPTEWYVCKDAHDKLPRQDIQLTSKMENRVFFVDEGFENNEPRDEAEDFYLYKSIAGLKVNQSAQNPITY
ncbi:MAG: LEM-3-like GIY-YIG domain-containing protein, partial [Lachnospiraceae bacterium]